MTKSRFSRPTLISAALLAGLFFAQSASAGEHGGEGKGHRGHRGAHFFKKIDTNQDGKIQRAEAAALETKRFAQMDANSDGVVTKAEAKSAAESFHQKRQEQRAAKGGEKKPHRIDGLFERADKNKDGKIARDESRLPTEKFDSVDANSDGYITREEMTSAMKEWKQAHGEKMFAMMDTNGDGLITRAEATARADARFQKMDANSDGEVTREEARAAHPHHKGKRGTEARKTRDHSRVRAHTRTTTA